MSRPFTIALLDDYQGAGLQAADWMRLPADAEVRSIHDSLRDDPLIDALSDVDAVVVMRERTAFTAEIFERLPRLRLLVTTGPSNAVIDLPAAASAGVTVCGTRGGGIRPTIELTWALILAVARDLPAETDGVRRGDWQVGVGRDLHGRQLGVVGLGGVGSDVARIGAAFGMDVVAWSPHLDLKTVRSVGARAVGKNELFAGSDVVTVHMKLVEATRGLVGAREISMMRRGSVLVNTSRGPIVDEEALLTAVRSGHLGGVGLDVFSEEPLPSNSPWRTEPRAVVTPHLGFVSEDTYRTWYGDALEDVLAYLDGEPIRVLSA